jgi:hypothetical protein
MFLRERRQRGDFKWSGPTQQTCLLTCLQSPSLLQQFKPIAYELVCVPFERMGEHAYNMKIYFEEDLLGFGSFYLQDGLS